MGVEYDGIREIPLDRLHISSTQARTREVEEGLEELVENIRKHNQLEPIDVMRADDYSGPPDEYQGMYHVIAGQRRVLAHHRLGKKSITAMVMRNRVDESTAKALSVSENLIRKDLSEKDLIDACTEFFRRYGSTEAVADELGLPEYRVRAYVKYDRLSGELKQAVREGHVDMQVALQAEDLKSASSENINPVEEAKKLNGMTKAQRRRYVTAKKKHQAGADRDDGNDFPGEIDVRQIVVTLRVRTHGSLKEWSRAQRLTMDHGAAKIIESFFDGRGRRVPIER